MCVCVCVCVCACVCMRVCVCARACACVCVKLKLNNCNHNAHLYSLVVDHVDKIYSIFKTKTDIFKLHTDATVLEIYLNRI